MADEHDQNLQQLFANLIDDPVIAHPDPPETLGVGQLDDPQHLPERTLVNLDNQPLSRGTDAITLGLRLPSPFCSPPLATGDTASPGRRPCTSRRRLPARHGRTVGTSVGPSTDQGAQAPKEGLWTG